MAENFSMRPILMLFVVLIIFISLLQILSNSQVGNTELSAKTNESITLQSATTGVVASYPTSQLLFFGNGTNNTISKGGTIGLDVNLSRNGSIAVSSFTYGGVGPYNVSYTYEGALYVQDDKSRSLLRLVPLFVAILGIVVGVIYFRQSSNDFNFGLR